MESGHQFLGLYIHAGEGRGAAAAQFCLVWATTSGRVFMTGIAPQSVASFFHHITHDELMQMVATLATERVA